MEKRITRQKVIVLLSVFLILFLTSSSAFSRTVTQLIPTLTITEEYSDNYLQTQTNKTDEFITTAQLGFSLGFLEKTHQLYLEYNPMYKLYDKNDQNDGLDHSASIKGNYKPSKHSDLVYGLNFSKTAVDRIGESRSSNAFANGRFLLSKNTSLILSQNYDRSFDQQVTNGSYVETDTNDSYIGLNYQFGAKDTIGVDYTYSFVEYETADSNDYNGHRPSMSLAYYFTPLLGMKSNLSYSTVNYDLTNTNTDTFTGDIRFIKNMTKHFGIYIKYSQSHSNQTDDKHDIYHPSVGFDWVPAENTGISLGTGVLFQQYEVQSSSDSEDIFIDLDMYKIFDLTRRSTLSVTGSSGYGEVDSEAASLGFTTYYQAGFNYTYRLTKRMNADIVGSYTLNQYDNPDNNRKDATANIGADLSWTPLKWLTLNFSYDFNDFDTDAAERGDYTENKFTISLSLIPTTPIRMDFTPTRKTLEDKIFNY